MPRNASGTMTALSTLAPPGQVSNSTLVNANQTDINTEITDSLSRSGKGGMLSALAMGTNKITGLASGTLATDAPTLAQVQSDVVRQATTVGGTADAITLTFGPTLTAFPANTKIRWKSSGANTTTAPTVTPDGFGPYTVKKGAAAALAVGDLGASGQINEAVFDGTQLLLISQIPASAFTGGTLTSTTSMSSKDFNEAKGASVASASTTNIWSNADGNFLHITGTTTITSFGTAPQAGAERELIFDGALTLTHNATSLILPGGANITTAAGDRCRVRADTTTNMYVTHYTKASGQAVVVPAAGATVINKATQDSRTTTTLTNDSDFTFSMLANTNYLITGVYYINVSSTTGAKIGVSGPASPTSVTLEAAPYGISTWSPQLNVGTGASATVTLTSSASTGDNSIRFSINFRNGANAGTFTLQTALQTAAGTTAFKVGSWMQYQTY